MNSELEKEMVATMKEMSDGIKTNSALAKELTTKVMAQNYILEAILSVSNTDDLKKILTSIETKAEELEQGSPGRKFCADAAEIVARYLSDPTSPKPPTKLTLIE